MTTNYWPFTRSELPFTSHQLFLTCSPPLRSQHLSQNVSGSCQPTKTIDQDQSRRIPVCGTGEPDTSYPNGLNHRLMVTHLLLPPTLPSSRSLATPLFSSPPPLFEKDFQIITNFESCISQFSWLKHGRVGWNIYSKKKEKTNHF